MKQKKKDNPDGSNVVVGDESSGHNKRRKVDSNISDNGLIKVMQQFNETMITMEVKIGVIINNLQQNFMKKNVKLQVDLITTSNDIKDQLRRVEERFLKKVRDIEIRQEALEIVFENQEKDVEYLKNISRFQLDCLNGLFQIVLQLFARHPRNTFEKDPQTESVSVAPAIETVEIQWPVQAPVQGLSIAQQPPRLEPQSPTQNTDVYTFQPEAGPSQNTSDAEVNTDNDNTITTESECGYCHKSFKKERNFLKHMQSIPKYCARKRVKMNVPF